MQVLSLRELAEVKCSDGADDGSASACSPLKAPCLFNVATDPCERRNLAHRYLCTFSHRDRATSRTFCQWP